MTDNSERNIFQFVILLKYISIPRLNNALK